MWFNTFILMFTPLNWLHFKIRNRENSKQNSENVARLEENMEKEKQSTMKAFAELSSHDASIDKELISQKVCAVCTFNIEHCFI